jgi:hypothetical protein
LRDVREPAVRGLFGFQVLGVPVLLHIALVERAVWIEEDAHVVVCVVFEPDADAGGAVEPEVFPCPPQSLYTGDCFRVEIPLEAPFAERPSTSRT